MTNDLMEKNGKLDQMMEQEEEYQKIKNSLELDIYSKQQHIMECEKVINELHHANSQDMSRQQMCNEYEAQLGEFKLKLTNREHEIQKIKQMYMDVCSEKNNLQDSIKSQYDTEYEKKLKQRLDACLTDKLEEQKAVLTEHWQIERTSFNDEHRRKCDIFLADLKELREQLNTSEKQCDQIRLDKANLELKSNRIETDLKEKCNLLERTISEFNLGKCYEFCFCLQFFLRFRFICF
jgi:chromosome segregation ATPase